MEFGEIDGVASMTNGRELLGHLEAFGLQLAAFKESPHFRIFKTEMRGLQVSLHPMLDVSIMIKVRTALGHSSRFPGNLRARAARDAGPTSQPAPYQVHQVQHGVPGAGVSAYVESPQQHDQGGPGLMHITAHGRSSVLSICLPTGQVRALCCKAAARLSLSTVISHRLSPCRGGWQESSAQLVMVASPACLW